MKISNTAAAGVCKNLGKRSKEPGSFGMKVSGPSLGVDDVTEFRIGENDSGIGEPGPPQVGRVACAGDGAMHERKTGGIVSVVSCLCCDQGHWFTRNNMYLRVLQTQ